MQLVEQGRIGLDDDVRAIVPALKDIEVLRGFEDDKSVDDGNTHAPPADDSRLGKSTRSIKPSKPILEKVKNKITLRLLLTHSTGFCYDGSHPLLVKWSKVKQRTANTFSGSIDGYTHPLLFQPGEAWMYGPSIDWAGQVVEALTKQTLGEYMEKNIWSKLGATNTTFHPERCRNMLPPQMDMGFRKNRSAPLTKGSNPYANPAPGDMGGIGLYSTADDYIKLLAALITGGGPLLQKESVDELLRPQLGEESLKSMKEIFQQPSGWGGLWGKGIDGDYALAGSVNLGDVPGRRKKGSINWGGMPNLHWVSHDNACLGMC